MNIEEFLIELKTCWGKDKAESVEVNAVEVRDYDKNQTIRIVDKERTYCPITYLAYRKAGVYYELEDVVDAADILEVGWEDRQNIISAADSLPGWEEYPDIVKVHDKFRTCLGILEVKTAQVLPFTEVTT